MAEEEVIQGELIKRFSFLEDKVRVQRQRRIFVETPLENFREVFEYVVKVMGFSFLCTITGLDEGQTFGFIYHLARREGIILNLKISIPKENPMLKTITPYFPNADIYEREIVDLFGIKIEGLPRGKRYPLPDDWPKNDHPLRKDWRKNA